VLDVDVSSCRGVIRTVVDYATVMKACVVQAYWTARSKTAGGARFGRAARRATLALAEMRPTVRSAIPLACLSRGGVPSIAYPKEDKQATYSAER
jgi:hypothetical protein